MTPREDASKWVVLLKAVPIWLVSSLGARIWLRTCDRVGAKTRTFRRPNIENRGRMVLGSRVRLNSGWAPVELVSGPDGVVDICALDRTQQPRQSGEYHNT